MTTPHHSTIQKGLLSLLGGLCLLSSQAQAQKDKLEPLPSTAEAAVQKKGLEMVGDAYEADLMPRHLKKLIKSETVHGSRNFPYPKPFARFAPKGDDLSYYVVYEDENRLIAVKDYKVNGVMIPQFHVFPKKIVADNILSPRPKMKVPDQYFPISKKEAQTIKEEGNLKLMMALSYGLNLRAYASFIWYQPPFKEEQSVGRVADLATCYYQDPKQWAEYTDEAKRASMPISKQVDAILGVCCPSILDIPRYFEKAYFQVFLPQRMHLMVEDAPLPAKHELAVLYIYTPHSQIGHDGLAESKTVITQFLRDQRDNIHRNLVCMQANLYSYHQYLLAQEGSDSSASCKLVGEWLSALEKYAIMFVRDGEIDQDIINNYKKYKSKDGAKFIDFGKMMKIRYEP